MIITDYKGQHGHDILAGTMNNGAPQHIRKFLDFADSLQVPGLSFTAIHDDNIIASGGFKLLWQGVAEIWFLASNRFHDHKKTIIKLVKVKIEEVVLEHRLVRLQTAVRTDWPQAQRFAQFFGLENEGLMKKYGPDGTDYFRYSRVYEWV